MHSWLGRPIWNALSGIICLDYYHSLSDDPVYETLKLFTTTQDV